jgi:hypothetical protein
MMFFRNNKGSKPILLISFLLLVFTADSKEAAAPSRLPLFAINYSLNILITSILPANDGYIGAGTASVDGFQYDQPFVVKVDQNGKVLWSKAYVLGAAYYGIAEKILRTQDGNFVVVAQKIEQQPQTFDFTVVDPVIIKINPSGRVIWRRTISGPHTDVLYDIDSTPDGGLVLAGATDSFGRSEYLDAWLLKLHRNGAVQWSRTFGGSQYDEFTKVITTNTGEIILTGSTDFFVRGPGRGLVMKLNQDGTVQWQRILELAGGYLQLFEMGVSSSGKVFVAGIVSDAKSSYGPDIFIARISPTGGLLWKKELGGSLDELVYDLKVQEDESIVITGQTFSYGHGHRDALMVKMSAAGNRVWARTFGDSLSDGFVSIQSTSDGGFVAAGDHGLLFTPDDPDVDFNTSIVRLNSTGMIPGCSLFRSPQIKIRPSRVRYVARQFVVGNASVQSKPLALKVRNIAVRSKPVCQ